jgi:hypothetical protein
MHRQQGKVLGLGLAANNLRLRVAIEVGLRNDLSKL